MKLSPQCLGCLIEVGLGLLVIGIIIWCLLDPGGQP